MDGYDEDLPPSEAARERRRDRDAEAHARAGMKSGLAKQFKQVLDSQVKRGREAADRLPDETDRRGRDEPRDRPAR
jgi:hypothetical protein